MPEEVPAVSYEALQDLLRAERRGNKLMPVPVRFWADVRTYLDTVTAEFRAEQAQDPFSRKVMVLTDQVKNARHAAESLWALRERKLAMSALAHAKDRKRPEGLLPDEAALFERLSGVLDESRVRAVGVPLPGAASPVAVPPTVAPPPAAYAAAPAESPQAAMASMAEPAPVVVQADTQAAAGEELVTIRALGDIPPFVGPDMQTYLLKAGDIATVPPSIAKLLEKRKKAAILDL